MKNYYCQNKVSDIWYQLEKENGVTRFFLEPCELEKWMYQNKAEYTGDFVEGCLLDNFVVVTKRGFAAVYESYVNSWTSCYYIEFQTGAAQDIFSRWYKFYDDCNVEEA